VLAAGLVALGGGASEAPRRRLAADARASRPLVAHVVVALCDNQHQGIVPVPKSLGNGQTPGTNLYWGARYGLKTFLTRDGGWRAVPCESRAPEGVLERLVLRRAIRRADGRSATAWVVADAWDGRWVRNAVARFLRMAGGHDAETLRVGTAKNAAPLAAGGAAHVVAYVGHNGLMDFALPDVPAAAPRRPARSAIVLACKSRGYFTKPLRRAGAHRLLLTTGFLAPEAYSLDAALEAWLAGGTTAATRETAAKAYHRYQNCGLRGARRLFAAEP
jgi:hypothetical protein